MEYETALSPNRTNHKLAVIMSRKAPFAVILRRGPSRWYHVMKWDMRKDELEHGAWFKGRIYEQKCDLSDDGKLFLYSVFKGSHLSTHYTGSYTGLSTAPWMKAHALWPQGSTYLGGGEFQGVSAIGIWTLPLMQKMHPEHTDTRNYRINNLLTTDGWHENQALIDEADWSKYDLKQRIIWHKGYCVYARKHGKDSLLFDLSDLSPEHTTAPY